MDLMTWTIYIIGFTVMTIIVIVFVGLVIWATIDNIRLHKENKIEAQKIDLYIKMQELKEEKRQQQHR